jgi:UPF0176 protein
MPKFLVIALYKFVDLPDYKEKRQPLLDFCQDRNVTGSILLAREGINGTIAGSKENIMAFIDFLKSDPRLASLEYKESWCDEQPFLRTKVRLKKEIVTLGVPEANPNVQVGKYVKPEDWNDLISDPDVVIVDTRNDYEVEIGTFKGAKNPKTESFREFPEYVKKNLDPKRHKKVAMFCTGGIRCEKASSYMLHQGFKEVYHLQGGILKYLEKVPSEKSLWKGECFVFDQRVSVKAKLVPGTYKLCYACQFPVSPEDMKSSLYKEGISCPRCHDQLTAEKRRRVEERERQMKLAKKRGQKHLANTLPVKSKKVSSGTKTPKEEF